MVWLKIKDDTEALTFPTSFWEKLHVDAASGEFWAHRIKKLRDTPEERLVLAVNNLPLPAAFREATIALRAMIRAKQKEKGSYSNELKLLYWLAAVNSFSVPYSNSLSQPGYNIMESIPGEVIKQLSFDYETLGYDKLELLNKTDKKWFDKAWGRPSIHTTLHKLHENIWKEYEQALVKKQKINRQQLHEKTLGRKSFFD